MWKKLHAGASHDWLPSSACCKYEPTGPGISREIPASGNSSLSILIITDYHSYKHLIAVLAAIRLCGLASLDAFAWSLPDGGRNIRWDCNLYTTWYAQVYFMKSTTRMSCWLWKCIVERDLQQFSLYYLLPGMLFHPSRLKTSLWWESGIHLP